MFPDLFVRVNTDDEVFSHRFGLSDLVGVPEVDHVVTPIAPHTYSRAESGIYLFLTRHFDAVFCCFCDWKVVISWLLKFVFSIPSVNQSYDNFVLTSPYFYFYFFRFINNFSSKFRISSYYFIAQKIR